MKRLLHGHPPCMGTLAILLLLVLVLLLCSFGFQFLISAPDF